ncbi:MULTISPECIES: DUF4238 domain-containing protein [unclassified Phyllobacterium]|uniref:DUF4238 domain-containing protein n=1 Tax=unclassified Phyllobacterium TaxID=2638441 RepID=UPI003012DDD1
MPNPKKHHYIPMLVQKHFALDGRLWAYNSHAPELGVYEDRPDNLFYSKYEYSKYEDDGTRDPKLEIEYSKKESDWAPLIEKIVNAVRNGKAPNLTSSERLLWDDFFQNQWRRVPELRRHLLPAERIQTDVKKIIEQYIASGKKIDAAERQRLESIEWAKVARQNTQVNVLRNVSPRVSDALQRRGLIFASPTAANKSFIIGSIPIAVFMNGNDGYRLDSYLSEAWLPIAPDVAVSPSPHPSGELLAEINGDQVRHVNTMLARQSRHIAGRSRELVESLSKYVAVGVTTQQSRPG